MNGKTTYLLKINRQHPLHPSIFIVSVSILNPISIRISVYLCLYIPILFKLYFITNMLVNATPNSLFLFMFLLLFRCWLLPMRLYGTLLDQSFRFSQKYRYYNVALHTEGTFCSTNKCIAQPKKKGVISRENSQLIGRT